MPPPYPLIVEVGNRIELGHGEVVQVDPRGIATGRRKHASSAARPGVGLLQGDPGDGLDVNVRRKLLIRDYGGNCSNPCPARVIG